ncbi:hypothetical protein CWB72_11965 [Pseudoalteromonas phenolica]|uniref:hypothetical protein n=1 Tax=Pseudoalteromonas phenolica TaxID=161398 RepID=UPI00110BA82F|nr:hypothetical protein [Pseudoalteromonas phenolica]TMN88914.1 hypothetical protein CWB72_11965 [Pseudoalteromonas phenolica]
MVIKWFDHFSNTDFWSSVPILLSAIVVSAVGIYIAKYLNKKAENLATKEDFDMLLEQVKESTIVTESVKVKLAEAGWLNQQGWNIREKYYTSLLIELNSFAEALGEELESRKFRKLLHQEKDASLADIGMLLKSSKNHIRELRILQGPAQMVISEEVSSMLNELHFRIWEVQKDEELVDRIEHILHLQADIQSVQKTLTSEARDALIRKNI